MIDLADKICDKTKGCTREYSHSGACHSIKPLGSSMVVLVCGGRDYDNWERLFRILDEIHAETPISKLVHGGARGADSLAERWAKNHEVPHMCYPARWKLYGSRRAGPLRNQEMLDKEPGIRMVVAFPGGSGTKDMTDRAQKAGVPDIRWISG